ncbi:hypothetical protein [Pontibacter pamirensis]|uniref:hypothetical protein n=1 Tax=Pontibacter pamirensis TaxID=2562824 RepID=UPI001F312510|nr:hypothetical protein [Pontibacter pamirensis]
MKNYFLYFLVSLLLLVPLQPQAQIQTDTLPVASSVSIDQQENPLFKNEEVLQFRITMDMKTVLKDRGEERGYHPAVISYKDKGGTEVLVPFKIMVRGNRRRDPTICGFPPLMLNFSRKTVEKTVFGKVNKLKLVTHCNGHEYVLREYLVYKLYNTITDHSFRARLCKIEYVDQAGKRKTESQYGFLLEDDVDMARRNKGEIVKKELALKMDETNKLAMAKVAMFQYMIGNTDWSVPYRHNIRLLSLDSLQAPFPVPYDFDYSGIVSTPYAVPPPELGITSVRHRLFRGYSFPDETYKEVINTFNRHKTNFYTIYQQNSLIDERYRKQTLKFLDEFYETINDPKSFHKKIVRVGEQNSKGTVVITGLK